MKDKSILLIGKSFKFYLFERVENIGELENKSGVLVVLNQDDFILQICNSDNVRHEVENIFENEFKLYVSYINGDCMRNEIVADLFEGMCSFKQVFSWQKF